MSSKQIHRSASGLPRREFLKGAAVVVGASMLSTSAVSRLLPNGAQACEVFYLGSNGLISAQKVGADATLETVRVLASGTGSGPIQALRANFRLSGTDAGRSVPFLAWTRQSLLHAFTMPVQPVGNLSFTISTQAGDSTVELTIVNGVGNRLREGTYLFAPSGSKWQGGSIQGGPGEWTLFGKDGRPIDAQCLVLQIERA